MSAVINEITIGLKDDDVSINHRQLFEQSTRFNDF
jgi:hypothetical protein